MLFVGGWSLRNLFSCSVACSVVLEWSFVGIGVRWFQVMGNRININKYVVRWTALTPPDIVLFAAAPTLKKSCWIHIIEGFGSFFCSNARRVIDQNILSCKFRNIERLFTWNSISGRNELISWRYIPLKTPEKWYFVSIFCRGRVD